MPGSHHVIRIRMFRARCAAHAKCVSRLRWLSVVPGLLCMTMVHADTGSDSWISDTWKGPALAQTLDEADLRDLPRHVFADGRGLPDGEGNASDGAVLYKQLCASCHGSEGQGGKALELVGDRALLATDYPDRGIAVYWPNAATLYEYVYRSMPPEQPASLSENELYAILAYVLELNDLLAPETMLNAEVLKAIDMPNQNGFVTIAQ